MYKGLKQKGRVNGQVVRTDFVVARSTIPKAGRGVFCMSKTEVNEGDKLLPYFDPAKGPVFQVDSGSKSQYVLGDETHGIWDLEGSEYNGILAGLANDTLSEDECEYSGYLEWDNASQMWWIKASHFWDKGTTVEITIPYGIEYWIKRISDLTVKQRKEFHKNNEAAIQELIDDGKHRDYLNPFTGEPILTSGDKARALEAVGARKKAGGRPKKVHRLAGRKRGYHGQMI
jgi:hypothetical protein